MRRAPSQAWTIALFSTYNVILSHLSGKCVLFFHWASNICFWSRGRNHWMLIKTDAAEKKARLSETDAFYIRPYWTRISFDFPNFTLLCLAVSMWIELKNSPKIVSHQTVNSYVQLRDSEECTAASFWIQNESIMRWNQICLEVEAFLLSTISKKL